jgi:hypothetical protein
MITRADSTTIVVPVPAENLAFNRYLASLHDRDPFTESGPVAVTIEASLPGRKQSRVRAIRQTNDSERSEYVVLESEGDASVTQQVIEPYLAVREQIEDLPFSSVAITPANYKFRYVGEFYTPEGSAFVFQITPKKKRSGLIRGQLWIDSVSGAAVVQAGYLVKTPRASIHRVEIVRRTKLQDGKPCSRMTRVAMQTRGAERGYLQMTEFPPAEVTGSVPALESSVRKRAATRSQAGSIALR